MIDYFFIQAKNVISRKNIIKQVAKTARFRGDMLKSVRNIASQRLKFCVYSTVQNL